MPQSSPYPYLFLSQLHKQFSICSGWHTHGFQSCHPFARALSFRIWGICPQLLCTSPGKHAVLLWITVKSRKAHVPRKWLLYTSFREAKVNSVSIPRQTSVFQASPMNLCLVRQVPAIPSSISFAGVFFRQASQWVSSFSPQLLLTTDGHACFLLYSLHGCTSS